MATLSLVCTPTLAQSQLLERSFKPAPTQIYDLVSLKNTKGLAGLLAWAASRVLAQQQFEAGTKCSNIGELVLWLNGPTKPKVFANQIFFHLEQLGFKTKVLKEVEWEIAVSRVFKMDTSLGPLYGLVVSYSQPPPLLDIPQRFSYLAWCIAK